MRLEIVVALWLLWWVVGAWGANKSGQKVGRFLAEEAIDRQGDTGPVQEAEGER